MLWGPDSMVPQPQDVIDIWPHFKWFVGKGPRPQFDRWTYWEKFDYWAVFWGMFIIGGSGLLLWFPVFFAKLLPGWMFNIATLVHGEEALLAVGFIFTFHFFNGHLRPEKFPMDTVIFTGVIPEHELKEERPVEYAAAAAAQGALAAKEAPPPTAGSNWFGWVVGGTALVLGVHHRRASSSTALLSVGDTRRPDPADAAPDAAGASATARFDRQGARNDAEARSAAALMLGMATTLRRRPDRRWRCSPPAASPPGSTRTATRSAPTTATRCTPRSRGPTRCPRTPASSASSATWAGCRRCS